MSTEEELKQSILQLQTKLEDVQQQKKEQESAQAREEAKRQAKTRFKNKNPHTNWKDNVAKVAAWRYKPDSKGYFSVVNIRIFTRAVMFINYETLRALHDLNLDPGLTLEDGQEWPWGKVGPAIRSKDPKLGIRYVLELGPAFCEEDRKSSTKRALSKPEQSTPKRLKPTTGGHGDTEQGLTHSTSSQEDIDFVWVVANPKQLPLYFTTSLLKKLENTADWPEGSDKITSVKAYMLGNTQGFRFTTILEEPNMRLRVCDVLQVTPPGVVPAGISVTTRQFTQVEVSVPHELGLEMVKSMYYNADVLLDYFKK